MFDIDTLNEIRRWELTAVLPYLPPSGRILEIGGGTGAQAAVLSRLGYDVISIDLPDSNYASEREFPVIDYDGGTFPAEDSSIDVVFSSNTLEHISDRASIHRETRRVLTPAGYAIHVMPSATWRVWTALTHYVATTYHAIRFAITRLAGESPRSHVTGAGGALDASQAQAVARVRSMLMPPRHGVSGTVMSEIYTFSRLAWKRHFTKSGFDVLAIRPMRLYYSGALVLGRRLSLRRRQRMSRLLGSSTVLYHVTPRALPRSRPCG
jgi:SAM-dependent methyltransferase